jgi:transposase
MPRAIQQIPAWLQEWAKVREFADAKTFIHELLKVEFESYKRYQREQKKCWPKFAPLATAKQAQARRSPDPERDLRILALLEAGQLTVREIADRENVSRSSVRRIRDNSKMKFDPVTIQKILHLHVAENMNSIELAQRFGSSASAIGRLLHQYDARPHVHGAVPGRKQRHRGAEISLSPREAA